MWRYLFGAILIGGLATEIPRILQSYEAKPSQSSAPSNTQQTKLVTPKQAPSANPLEGRVARIKQNRNGQFVTSIRMNGYRTNVLVDTGATSVAINETTARRMGIHLDHSDFKHKASTANGITYGAAAMINDIEVGRIRVRNVRAMVLRDKALDGVLLGMTFLNQLKKFEVNRGTLILTQ